MMRPLRSITAIVAIALSIIGNDVVAQCTDYTITVGGGSAQGQIHWELQDGFGNIVASGDAPEDTGECLPDGCYTMVMYDDGGNGWQGGTYTITYENTTTVLATGTLSAGGYGTELVDLNGGCGTGGCADKTIAVTAGADPLNVYWEIVDQFGFIVASGSAPENSTYCLPDGCYTMYLYDFLGDGWNGAEYTITDVATGNVEGTGTLLNGGFASAQLILGAGCGACELFTFDVTAGSAPSDISWDLYDANFNFVATGTAPMSQDLCVPAGCYTLYMYDAMNDGWNGAQFAFTQQSSGLVVSSGTLISGGFGTAQVSIGGGCGIGTCTDHTLVITSGSAPADISWNFTSMGVNYASGWAPSTMSVCVDTGCYVMQMYDAAGNGWNGATWTLLDQFGAVVQSGTLSSGASGATAVPVGTTGPCTVPIVVTASDCPQAVNVCTNLNFTIDPNGWGAIWEIPALGSTSNPEFYWGDGTNSPWGTDHYGCLMGQEINTTWMIVNIAVGGSLEFTLGANGSQAGFYDWTMFPYGTATCSSILANTISPIRCNWNYASSGGTGLVSTVPPGGFPENFEPPLNVLAGERYLICFSNWSSVTTVVPLLFGGTAVVSCSSVLPLELLSFEALANGAIVDLNWTTASETNSSRFEIERSSDLNAWEWIGTIQATGHSDVMVDYDFKDDRPVVDKPYYRLRMLDLDGTSTFSPVRSVRFSADAPLCYPNPSDGDFVIRQLTEGANVRVSDALGHEIAASMAFSGTNAARIKLLTADDGVYTVRIEQEGLVITERILVARR
ncbi:MAG: T9SS type A sorting domain-containing protein [Flavobacteriales bacterium]